VTSTPPIAPRRPHVHVAHGDRRPDDYFWLRDRDDPEVRAYLEAENAYTDAATAGLAGLRDELYAEIAARIQQTDTSAPVADGPWRYYTRTIEGLQYEIHCRTPRDAEEPETVLLDENALASGHDYFDLGVFAISPDHRLLAYGVDTRGDESYTVRVRDLETGADLGDVIGGVAGGGAEWASDNATLLYLTLDDAQRPDRLWRHRLGTDPRRDDLVYPEPDQHFYLSIGRTRSDAFLVLSASSKITSEVWVLPAEEPDGAFRLVRERRPGMEYDLEHHCDRFLIVTNEEADDFRLMDAPVDDPAAWREVVAHRPGVRLDAVLAFAGHLVFAERADGMGRLRIQRLDTGEEHVIEQPEPAHTVWPGLNPEFDSRVLRFGYSSLKTPASVFAYDLDTRERELLKQTPVLGGYDPDRFVTERLWATAPDGTLVPISLVALAGTPRDGSAPLVLQGYGSYEFPSDPYFSTFRLSLLERGVLVAIAHVRGGGEMGRRWYTEGKLHAKANTFTDFVACAEHLVAEGWTSPERLAIRGGSAGGLLVGAAMNLRPDLFRAVVAEVPFVDVLTTILDASLPLTVLEWDEWGDPSDPAFYRTIKAYSPYDNVRAARYPDLLATAGLNDPRVAFWEPAKWVAKLRATAEPGSRILLKTEMGAGHGGPSGRYDAWRDEAFVLAFLLDALGVVKSEPPDQAERLVDDVDRPGAP
jgi:oligopeptidase B